MKQLPRGVVAAADRAKIMGVKAGARSDHRFTGVWPVVVNGRLFARSWSRAADGWYRRLLIDPLGRIQVDDREVPIRARPVRSERLRDAVEEAYAAKYVTPGAKKWVRGFRSARRREATIEFTGR
jgi:hypothetical protein